MGTESYLGWPVGTQLDPGGKTGYVPGYYSYAGNWYAYGTPPTVTPTPPSVPSVPGYDIDETGQISDISTPVPTTKWTKFKQAEEGKGVYKTPQEAESAPVPTTKWTEFKQAEEGKGVYKVPQEAAIPSTPSPYVYQPEKTAIPEIMSEEEAAEFSEQARIDWEKEQEQIQKEHAAYLEREKAKAIGSKDERQQLFLDRYGDKVLNPTGDLDEEIVEQLRIYLLRKDGIVNDAGVVTAIGREVYGLGLGGEDVIGTLDSPNYLMSQVSDIPLNVDLIKAGYAIGSEYGGVRAMMKDQGNIEAWMPPPRAVEITVTKMQLLKKREDELNKELERAKDAGDKKWQTEIENSLQEIQDTWDKASEWLSENYGELVIKNVYAQNPYDSWEIGTDDHGQPMLQYVDPISGKTVCIAKNYIDSTTEPYRYSRDGGVTWDTELPKCTNSECSIDYGSLSMLKQYVDKYGFTQSGLDMVKEEAEPPEMQEIPPTAKEQKEAEDWVKSQLQQDFNDATEYMPEIEKENINELYEDNPLIASIIAGVSDFKIGQYYPREAIIGTKELMQSLGDIEIGYGGQIMTVDQYNSLPEKQRYVFKILGGLDTFVESQRKMLAPYKIANGKDLYDEEGNKTGEIPPMYDVPTALREHNPDITKAVYALHKVEDISNQIEGMVINPTPWPKDFEWGNIGQWVNTAIQSSHEHLKYAAEVIASQTAIPLIQELYQMADAKLKTGVSKGEYVYEGDLMPVETPIEADPAKMLGLVFFRDHFRDKYGDDVYRELLTEAAQRISDNKDKLQEIFDEKAVQMAQSAFDDPRYKSLLVMKDEHEKLLADAKATGDVRAWFYEQQLNTINNDLREYTDPSYNAPKEFAENFGMELAKISDQIKELGQDKEGFFNDVLFAPIRGGAEALWCIAQLAGPIPLQIGATVLGGLESYSKILDMPKASEMLQKQGTQQLAGLGTGLAAFGAETASDVIRDPAYGLGTIVGFAVGPKGALKVGKAFADFPVASLWNVGMVSILPRIATVLPKNVNPEILRRHTETAMQHLFERAPEAYGELIATSRDVVINTPDGTITIRVTPLQRLFPKTLVHVTPDLGPFKIEMSDKGYYITKGGKPIGGEYDSYHAALNFILRNEPINPGFIFTAISKSDVGVLPKAMTDLLFQGKLGEAKKLFKEMLESGELDINKMYPVFKWTSRGRVELESWFPEGFHKVVLKGKAPDPVTGKLYETVPRWARVKDAPTAQFKMKSPVTIEKLGIKEGDPLTAYWVASENALREGFRLPSTSEVYAIKIMAMMTEMRKALSGKRPVTRRATDEDTIYTSTRESRLEPMMFETKGEAGKALVEVDLKSKAEATDPKHLLRQSVWDEGLDAEGNLTYLRPPRPHPVTGSMERTRVEAVPIDESTGSIVLTHSYADNFPIDVFGFPGGGVHITGKGTEAIRGGMGIEMFQPENISLTYGLNPKDAAWQQVKEEVGLIADESNIKLLGIYLGKGSEYGLTGQRVYVFDVSGQAPDPLRYHVRGVSRAPAGTKTEVDNYKVWNPKSGEKITVSPDTYYILEGLAESRPDLGINMKNVSIFKGDTRYKVDQLLMTADKEFAKRIKDGTMPTEADISEAATIRRQMLQDYYKKELESAKYGITVAGIPIKEAVAVYDFLAGANRIYAVNPLMFPIIIAKPLIKKFIEKVRSIAEKRASEGENYISAFEDELKANKNEILSEVDKAIVEEYKEPTEELPSEVARVEEEIVEPSVGVTEGVVTPEVTKGVEGIVSDLTERGGILEIKIDDNVVGSTDVAIRDDAVMITRISVPEQYQGQDIATKLQLEVQRIASEADKPVYAGILSKEGEAFLKALDKKGIIKLEPTEGITKIEGVDVETTYKVEIPEQEISIDLVIRLTETQREWLERVGLEKAKELIGEERVSKIIEDINRDYETWEEWLERIGDEKAIEIIGKEQVDKIKSFEPIRMQTAKEYIAMVGKEKAQELIGTHQVDRILQSMKIDESIVRNQRIVFNEMEWVGKQLNAKDKLGHFINSEEARWYLSRQWEGLYKEYIELIKRASPEIIRDEVSLIRKLIDNKDELTPKIDEVTLKSMEARIDELNGLLPEIKVTDKSLQKLKEDIDYREESEDIPYKPEAKRPFVPIKAYPDMTYLTTRNIIPELYATKYPIVVPTQTRYPEVPTKYPEKPYMEQPTKYPVTPVTTPTKYPKVPVTTPTKYPVTPTITPVPTPTTVVGIPAIPEKICKTALQKFEELTTEQRLGSIAWKQGWAYHLIYPPYGQENILHSRQPFPGVKVASGPQSAYESVARVQGAALPDEVSWDMGIVNVGFKRDQKTGDPVIGYVGDKYQKIPAPPVKGYPGTVIRKTTKRTAPVITTMGSMR